MGLGREGDGERGDIHTHIADSVDGWRREGGGCVPSLLFDLRPNYGGVNEDNVDLLQKVPCTHCSTQGP